MQLAIFFIEVILIFFYITWDEQSVILETAKEEYYCYDAKDIIGNKILKFPSNISEEEKLKALEVSELMEEMLSYSSNIEIISEIFNNGVEDETQFKEDFIAYIEFVHSDYIGGKITNQELQELIKKPQNIHNF